MASKTLCTTLLLLGLLSVGSASSKNWGMRPLSGADQAMHCPAIIGTKVEVPPSMHTDFVNAWKKVEDSTLKEPGCQLYDLKKDKGSNDCFLIYGEWKETEDYMDHFKSDYMKDFISFLNQNDLMYTECVLMNVTEEKPAMRRALMRSYHAGQAQDQAAHVLMKFTVPPSMQDEFKDAWIKTARDVWQEEGNVVYTLRKYATNNYHWVVCGMWQTLDHYFQHMETEHHKRLHSFFADKDIVFETKMMEKLGKGAPRPSQM